MSAEIPEEALKAVRESGLEVQSWDPERRILTVGQQGRPTSGLLVYEDGTTQEVIRRIEPSDYLNDPLTSDENWPAPTTPYTGPTNRHERRKAAALARRQS